MKRYGNLMFTNTGYAKIEESPDGLYVLYADVEAMKAKVEQLPVYTTIQGSGMDAHIVHCFLTNDVLAIFEEGKP